MRCKKANWAHVFDSLMPRQKRKSIPKKRGFDCSLSANRRLQRQNRNVIVVGHTGSVTGSDFQIVRIYVLYIGFHILCAQQLAV